MKKVIMKLLIIPLMVISFMFGYYVCDKKLNVTPFDKMLEEGKYSIHLAERGYIPDENTAEKIADVVLTRAYGEDYMNKRKPYNVRYDKENFLWVVESTQVDNSKGGYPSVLMTENGLLLVVITHK